MSYEFDYPSDLNDYGYLDIGDGDGDDFEEYDDDYLYERAEASGVTVDETIDCVVSAWVDTLSQLYIVIVFCTTFHVLSYVFNPDIWRSSKLYTFQHILSALIGCFILYRVIEELVYFAVFSVAVFYALLCVSHHICAFLYRRHERKVNAKASAAHIGAQRNATPNRSRSSTDYSESSQQQTVTAPDRAAFQFRCMSVIIGGLSYMILLQSVVLDAVHWTRLRGVIMIQLMKIASLADLIDAQNVMQSSPLPPIANFAGYLLHCGSSLFGPFIPYSLYLRTLRRTVFMPRALTWWLHFLYALATTAFSLTYSFCAVHFVFSCLASVLFGSDMGEDVFFNGFRDAQSFRFSHYFVCKFSELQLLLTGLTYDESTDLRDLDGHAIEHRRDQPSESATAAGSSGRQRERNNSESSTSSVHNRMPQRAASAATGRQAGAGSKPETASNSHDLKTAKRKRSRDAFDFEVNTANIMKVELPRSMIDIANNWNIPMHLWLRQYVFMPLRARFRMPVAVLGTYAVSSLLHGLNFQLSAVLLSIGLLSYVEFVFRKKFSEVFSACIHVRRCPDDCSRHRFKNRNVYVKLANLAFLLLNCLHLMFLGMMFDNDESQTEGYSMQHTLEKWYSVYFCSYVIAALMFVVNLIV